ncbi:hypothetical protein I6E81_03330 [Salinibacterium sp. NG22]|uniref:DUF2510 domain-containing protein n=1 Tax=Salinibacterium sp. NG22 TaxID=2792040 RepID=UPI0018CC8888|nr:DUF2510 domain-containing protein [Salinibacterium sp. NG22]MBH0109192.1 hypothetical protein [Salinibacterium sp. NG22]
MNDASTPLPPAGWYRDPAGGAAPRWWSGTAWAAANTVPEEATPLPTPAPAAAAAAATSSAQSGAVPAATPPAAATKSVPPITPVSPAATTPAAATVGAPPVVNPAANYTYAAPSDISDTGTNTWQMWVFVFLPLISLPGLFAIDLDALVPRPTDTPTDAQLRLLVDPGYLWMMISGWLMFLVNIPLAIFDRRELDHRGIDRPFHWAFIFLGWLIYVIGRCVVVKNRTGQGLAPMWAAFGVLAIMFATTVVFMGMLFSRAVETL